MENNIIPFKNRVIDIKEQIEVYRNLNKKGKIYSIRQNGLVVAHATAIVMDYVYFVINKSGKERAITTKVRNVHALIRGKYCESQASANKTFLRGIINYKPFDKVGFTCTVDDYRPWEIKHAICCIINKDGVRVGLDDR